MAQNNFNAIHQLAHFAALQANQAVEWLVFTFICFSWWTFRRLLCLFAIVWNLLWIFLFLKQKERYKVAATWLAYISQYLSVLKLYLSFVGNPTCVWLISLLTGTWFLSSEWEILSRFLSFPVSQTLHCYISSIIMSTIVLESVSFESLVTIFVQLHKSVFLHSFALFVWLFSVSFLPHYFLLLVFQMINVPFCLIGLYDLWLVLLHAGRKAACKPVAPGVDNSLLQRYRIIVISGFMESEDRIPQWLLIDL